jgi:repressor LexA
MMDTPKLTARQQQILDLIQSAIARTGRTAHPRGDRGRARLQVRQRGEEHLQALARKGVIELVSGTSRGIRLQSEACAPSTNPASSSSSCRCRGWRSSHCPSSAAWPPARPSWRRNTSTRPTTSKAACSSAARLPAQGARHVDARRRHHGRRPARVQATKDAKNGQIIVARLGEDVTVKRFRATST